MIINLSDPRVKMYAKMYRITLEQAKKIVEKQEDKKEEQKAEPKGIKQNDNGNFMNILDYYAKLNAGFIKKQIRIIMILIIIVININKLIIFPLKR